MNNKIHITSDFCKLKSILKSKMLKLNGSDEVFYLGNKKVSSAAHPMVCFSEYDISTINEKVITYGKFGIAFTESWVENKLQQVLYVKKNSLVAKALATLLKARRITTLPNQLPPHVKQAIMEIKCFTKNDRGRNLNKLFDDPDYDFKSENEWRYVPSKAEIEGKLISESSKKYRANQLYYNKQWNKYSLKFTETDVVCVFVETNEEKEEVKALFPIDSRKIKISRWKTEWKK